MTVTASKGVLSGFLLFSALVVKTALLMILHFLVKTALSCRRDTQQSSPRCVHTAGGTPSSHHLVVYTAGGTPSSHRLVMTTQQEGHPAVIASLCPYTLRYTLRYPVVHPEVPVVHPAVHRSTPRGTSNPAVPPCRTTVRLGEEGGFFMDLGSMKKRTDETRRSSAKERRDKEAPQVSVREKAILPGYPRGVHLLTSLFLPGVPPAVPAPPGVPPAVPAVPPAVPGRSLLLLLYVQNCHLLDFPARPARVGRPFRPSSQCHSGLPGDLLKVAIMTVLTVLHRFYP